MANKTLLPILCMLVSTFGLAPRISAQSRQTYPSAVTDRLIHEETPMPPPPKNVVFVDPDFGSSIVRVTDETTNYNAPGTFFRIEGSGKANEWSADGKKFYVITRGGEDLVFGFDPVTMTISSLAQAEPGRGLRLPLRPDPTFSNVDSDLIYGTPDPYSLTIVSYRFSTGVSTPVIDTRTCGLDPTPGYGRSVVSDDDVSLSADDQRISISEGGSQFDKHMFVVVYDKTLGCRWYNTQTGQIGGQWGPQGMATIAASYLIAHARLARNGKYVRIGTTSAWYLWNLATLTVTSCPLDSAMDCGGYGAIGYNDYVNAPGTLDDMNVVKHPWSDLSQITPLVYPRPSTGWGQSAHFSWNNVDAKDSTPVCASMHSYDGDITIDQPFAGEIVCIETDGLASTVWRFAHHRAAFFPPYFHTQPLGTVSKDGGFFLFASDWDAQLGLGTDGTPRSDVFIVKLE